ncbi:MAG: hypothetical protein H7Z40_09800 [Phycisphaerae bacterium]|nr:hypothetical protein [Gemmatimonadaceae bacterium]
MTVQTNSRPYSRARRVLLSSAVGWLAVLATPAAPLAQAQPQTGATQAARAVTIALRDFGGTVARLSEPGGYFDTDNLISNESSYLHVIGALDRYGVKGGAYIGVGPDQNFSYIARIKPRMAFLIDIRRDNMLQHLMFKALFVNSRNRTEYLANWLGKKSPADVERWSGKSIEEIVAYLDATPSTSSVATAARTAVAAQVRGMGVALTDEDMATIGRFHQEFIDAGLSLRFTSAGRAPQPYYPTLRQLVLERDMEGKQSSYLAHEADFRVVQELQRGNYIIPVVGDLGGTKALPAIGTYMKQYGMVLSAFYVSNAEDYVLRDGKFSTFARSVAAMPRDSKSVFVRSFFGGGQHPEAVNGYYSTQLLQKVDVFVAEASGYSSYRQLVRSNYLPLRPQ